MGFFLHGCTVIHMQNLALEPIIGHSLLPQTVSYSYWWRARHVGVHKSLFMTSKKCWNIGMTRKLAPVLIRQFLHSYWSRAMAETVVPHHAIRATGTTFPYKELFTRGRRRVLPFHSCCVERNHLTILIFAFILLFDRKVMLFWPKRYLWMGIKVCWIGFQLVV